MNISNITTLIHFNYWASSRILAACERISLDEFTRLHPQDPGWGSLRGVLVHMLDTEYGWRSALQVLDEDNVLRENDFSDVPALRKRWEMERTAWFDYVASLSDESINLGYGDDSLKGPKV